MIFNTWTYGIFLAACALLYWAIVPKKARRHFLLLAGLAFYTYYYPAYTILIICVATVVYLTGTMIQRAESKTVSAYWLALGVTFCLVFLCYFKYTKMIISTLNSVLGRSPESAFPLPQLLVPLGLSFFVFEFIHYLVDMYRGIAKQTGVINFGTFALFFPTIVAGPIKRYEPFLEQMEDMPGFDSRHLLYGTARIIIGIAKKVIIADSMNLFITPLQNAHAASDLELAIALYAYAIKIYFDFSGYSDIAIGSARLFGIRIMENFNWPYLRRNIGEFWRNWHISLSSWIRDYLYIPLGGNRKGFPRQVFNSVFSMALCGLWHGASWNFVIWGMYHGLGLGVYRIWSKLKLPRLPLPVGIFLTFNFVVAGWAFFVCDFTTAKYVLLRLMQLTS